MISLLHQPAKSTRHTLYQTTRLCQFPNDFLLITHPLTIHPSFVDSFIGIHYYSSSCGSVFIVSSVTCLLVVCLHLHGRQQCPRLVKGLYCFTVYQISPSLHPFIAPSIPQPNRGPGSQTLQVHTYDLRSRHPLDLACLYRTHMQAT